MNSDSSGNREFTFGIRVKTKARIEGISGPIGEWYRVSVKEAPEKGKANKRVCQILAAFFGISPSRIEITNGHTSRDKTICIRGISKEEGLQKLSTCV